jgi:hypothetical protein
MQGLTPEDVAAMLGRDAGSVSRLVSQEALAGLEWRRLGRAERDAALRDAQRQLEVELETVGPERLARWERGWSEVLERVTRDGAREETLRPQYFRYDIVRFRGDYARVARPDFEFRLYRILADLIFREYLQGMEAVVEFACGTGLNLLHLGKLLPGIRLTGCDWARPSQSILGRIASEHGLNLTGRRVDLWSGEGFDPVALTGPGRTAVLTTHGLEQIGGHVGPFLDMVSALRPEIVLHIEPLVELYDPERAFDELAIRYHTRRNYLHGLLPAIRTLRDQGRAGILAERRLGLGSAFHEGYSLLVWRPL